MTGLRNRLFSGSLAQLVEQLAFNQLVEGSNPSRPTIIFFSEKYSEERVNVYQYIKADV